MEEEEVKDWVSVIEEKNASSEMEKIHLLAIITKSMDSLLAPYQPCEDGWDRENGLMLYINLPTGQVSFSVASEHAHWFSHVTRASMNPWDGHDDDVKIERIVGYIG